MRRQPYALDKETLKLPRTHARDFSQPVNARIAGQIGFDVAEGTVNLGRGLAGKAGTGRWPA